MSSGEQKVGSCLLQVKYRFVLKHDNPKLETTVGTRKVLVIEGSAYDAYCW